MKVDIAKEYLERYLSDRNKLIWDIERLDDKITLLRLLINGMEEDKPFVKYINAAYELGCIITRESLGKETK